MSKYAKWIGGGLGWAVGGPIGAIAGFVLGSLFDNASEVDMYNGKARQDPFQRQQTQTRSGDFTISLLILSAAIMKADGRVMKSELNYVKSFLVKQFGEHKALELVRTLREILDHDVSVRQVSLQIRQNMSHSMRLQLLHYLFGIAHADGKVEQVEFKLLRTISHYLGISDKDFYSISAMFGGAKSSIEDAYKILEVNKNASDSEIKKAYRKMAVKYHPDKVNSLGKDFQQAAKEKFQKVQEAYEQIKKERDMR